MQFGFPTLKFVVRKVLNVKKLKEHSGFSRS